MHYRQPRFIVCLLAGASAFVCTETSVARARSAPVRPIALQHVRFSHRDGEPPTNIAAQPALISLIADGEGRWATTLYYAAQNRTLSAFEMSLQIVPSTNGVSAVSLVFSAAPFLMTERTLPASAARVAFASGINDDTANETQERAENEALFYSATSATRGVSENALRGGAEQARTKSTAAGNSAAPTNGGLFSASGLPAQ